MVKSMLQDLNIKYKYDSDSDNLVKEFYIPVLSNSVRYYRMSGFFSSSSLAISARGITDFIKNNGQMKLLCSAELTKEDLDAMYNAKIFPEKYIEESFINDLNNLKDGFVKDHVEALGWMIANGNLEIKIAIPENSNGIFHSKIGILKDKNGDYLSFSGSDNETAMGWLYNIEEFKVFKSWDISEKKFVDTDLKDFKKYWNGHANKTEVIELPEAIKKELIKLSPSSKYDLKIFQHNKKNSPIKLRKYQKDAISSWFNNNCQGIFEMATGTGKTFTALSCFKKLNEKQDKLLTVIACPQSHLIDQWVKDVKKFFDGEIIIASSKNNSWKKDLKKLYKDFYFEVLNKAVVLTTHITLSSEYFMDIISDFNTEILLIIDEVHGIGSSKQMFALNEGIYKYRLGLSATPERWFDDEGTSVINNFFNGIVFEFDIERALTEINPDTGKTYLTPYIYKPIIVDLNDEEYEEYNYLNKKIASLISSKKKENKKFSLTNYCIKRQNIINNASEKYSAFRKILKENPNIDKLIVFCSPQQINNVQKILNEENIVPEHKFTQNESANKLRNEDYSERELILKNFEDGFYKALVAIKCLDEGVDVPSAKNGIILSSTSNPREHVQRRGRLLRNAPGKDKAIIYDILVFPKENTKIGNNIRRKEVKRYFEFAENALNSFECLKLLKKYYEGD